MYHVVKVGSTLASSAATARQVSCACEVASYSLQTDSDHNQPLVLVSIGFEKPEKFPNSKSNFQIYISCVKGDWMLMTDSIIEVYNI